MPTSTYLDLLSQAAQELNIIPRGTAMTDTSMQTFFLDRLTMMVDSWNLKPTVIPWYQQQILPLKVGQQSYLIGSGAPDWDAPRPVRLDPDGCNVLLANSSPPGRVSLTVLSVQQWANIPIQQLPNSIPQGVYLDRSVVVGPKAMTNWTINGAGGSTLDGISVNGAVLTTGGQVVIQVNRSYAPSTPYYASRIWVWGIPSTVNQIELFYWQALTVGNLTDPVNAAPGYFRAMALKLAIEVSGAYGMTPSALTIQNAADAFADIKELNAPDMSMIPDRGMPGSKYTGYISQAQFLSGNF